jgi:acyl carrier protein
MTATEKLKHFIVTQLMTDGDPSQLTETTPLIDSGIIDSLGIMSLLGFLESDFSIEVSGDDLVPENFASIATITGLISQKCGHV